MADDKKRTGTQGGSHEDHVKAGEQSHKNTPHKNNEKNAASPSTAHETKHSGHTLTKANEKKGGEHSHDKE